MEFKSVKLFKTLKNACQGWHFEQRLGTQKQASDYCKKEGDWIEFGKIKAQGYRGDLDRTRQMVKSGGLKQVTACCNLQQISVAKAFLTYNEKPRDWKPIVTWVWGPEGVGKSKHLRDLYAGQEIYCKSSSNKWWEGYDGEEYVIIDDIRSNWMCFTDLLGLLDRYEYRVEYKGGTRQFRARYIGVTSCYPPESLYKFSNENIKQLTRRIDVVIEKKAAASEVGASEVGGVILVPPMFSLNTEPDEDNVGI